MSDRVLSLILIIIIQFLAELCEEINNTHSCTLNMKLPDSSLYTKLGKLVSGYSFIIDEQK